MDAMAPLLSGALDPLFWRPSRLGVESAWIGHIPFAHWIVAAARPRMLVELGTHNGVSYCAFCEAVLAERLETRCYAVDTWAGDEHAGFYGEDVYENLRRFHDQRYAAFSELLRCTFDAALGYVADGSIDLLHIDGCHRYEDVRHDYETWLPKLSDRGVVLFHDTNVRERDFGVWRLFAELRQRHPGFEFLHEHGLGVLAVGRAVPEPVAALCALDDPARIAAIRERFALLGERWQVEERARLIAREAGAEAARMRARAAQRAGEARAAAAVALAELDRLRAQTESRLRELEAEAEAGRAAAKEAARLRLELRNAPKRGRLGASPVWQAGARAWPPLRRRLRQAARFVHWTVTLQLPARLRQHIRLRRDLALLSRSPLFDPGWYRARYPDVAASGLDPAVHYLLFGNREGRNPGPRFDAAWYLQQSPDVARLGMDPLVHYLRAGAAEGRPIRAPADTALPAAAPEGKPVHAPPQRRIVFISGEPETPGHVYRVVRLAAAAEQLGVVTSWMSVEEAVERRDELLAADILVVWRRPWSPPLADAVAAARSVGAKIVFDLDDLMLEPDLVRPELLDALRTLGIAEADARGHYERMREAVMQADFCLASTEELACHIRRTSRPALVLPNGFDEATWRRSRRAARRFRQGKGDGLIRIGYATGSRTHQRDFALIAGAVGRVLRERPDCRLVLFKSPADGLPVLDAAEYPELAGLGSQIEWRDLVPLAALPDEMARFDVNLAPLDIGNPFCEAKSELKYFEAALVGVCTVASPTGPFRRAIAHGRTGLLATTEAEWYAAISTLLDDAPLRRRLARAALLDVLWTYGPERRREFVASFLQQLEGGRDGARAFALDMHLGLAPRAAPTLPEGEILFEADQLGDADVTVVVPLYNYAQYVKEALDSVVAQTLRRLDLVIVDDASTDGSRALALDWAARHAARFNRIAVIGNAANAGLGLTRNAGFAAAETPYVLPLDADNRLRPACCELLLREARQSGAAFVYPVLQEFGDSEKLANVLEYVPARLIGVPYIDAMALVSRAAWAAVGGYSDSRLGWEDYEFWCRLAERGLFGRQVKGEPLAEYRVHQGSLLLSVTEDERNKPRVKADMVRRHPWLSLVDAPRTSGPAAPPS
jgi:glycosyltransferase involved in cell wall biosynthesis